MNAANSLLQMNGKRWFAALKLLLSAAAGGLLTFLVVR